MRPSATSSSSEGCSVKPTIWKLERCTRSSSRVRSVDGLLVVGDAGAIGGAHFAQHRARLRHHVGNAERAADLHQLAARDDDLAAFGQRIQRQQHRGGVVVDHEVETSRAAVQQSRKAADRRDVALAALAGREVEFQVGIAARNFRDVLQRGCGRAARVPDWCAG